MPSRTHGRISILLFLVCRCFVVELVTHMVAGWPLHFQFHLCISSQKGGRDRKAKAFPEILSRFPSHFTGQNCITSPPWAARGAIKLSIKEIFFFFPHSVVDIYYGKIFRCIRYFPGFGLVIPDWEDVCFAVVQLSFLIFYPFYEFIKNGD